MKLVKVNLRKALEMMAKDDVTIIIKVQGEYYRLHTFDPIGPMYLLCKLEFNGEYHKEELPDYTEALVITPT